MAILFVTVVALLALCVTWYAVSLRRKREKAKRDRALDSSVTGGTWPCGGNFMDGGIPLSRSFAAYMRRFSARVGARWKCARSKLPIHWLINKIKGPREVITFQADLDCPPTFSLQMQNFRWFARSSPKAEIEQSRMAV